MNNDTLHKSKSCPTPTVIIIAYNTALFPNTIDPIHAAAIMNKKRGLAGRFTANLRVST